MATYQPGRITIEMQENGYIRIEATDAGARAMGAVPWSKDSTETERIDALAATVAGKPVTRQWWRIKKGLSNVGFTATYLDEAKRDAFMAARRRPEREL